MAAEDRIREAFDEISEALGDLIDKARGRETDGVTLGSGVAAKAGVPAEALELIQRDLRMIQRRLLDALSTEQRPRQVVAEQWVQCITEPPMAVTRADERKPIAHPHQNQRAQAGKRIPQAFYRLPILEALVERGGAGTKSQVLDRVRDMIGDQLSAVHHEILASVNEPRWRNTASWERRRMVKEGLLANDSPHGVWEITAAGRRYLAEHARKKDDGTVELDERRGKTVRTIAKAARTGSKRRLSAGLRTPPSTYRIPILRALTEAGGVARTAWALDRVYELMQHRLNDYDLQMKPSGGLRWRNTAQWERLQMVKEGLLANDSPHGVWEITAAGRRYLDEHGDEG